MLPTMLPALEPPDDAARAHGARVAAHIASVIRAAGGWIDFARYMELALYAPGLGYYSAGATKFGAAGDFVTAPLLSPVFGRCLARSIAPALAAIRAPAILELGAGTGDLAVVLLESLRALGQPPERYLILEVSAELRARQRSVLGSRLPELAARVQWLETLPAGFRGVIVANEVADALPVHRFRRLRNAVAELGVVEEHATFAWAARSASPDLAAAVIRLEQALGAALPEGYTAELNLRLPAWIAALGAALDQGLLLLCDYGGSRHELYHPDRREGTLICHYRQRAHADVFWQPGLQDLSAWVDFSAVAEAATAAGLTVAGYATQAHFLLDTGIEAELGAWAGRGDAAALSSLQQAKTLLLPGEMGERFKVLACRRGNVPVAGFGFRDLRDRL
jgi:SAM-dependent MidA family methyltransferase